MFPLLHRPIALSNVRLEGGKPLAFGSVPFALGTSPTWYPKTFANGSSDVGFRPVFSCLAHGSRRRLSGTTERNPERLVVHRLPDLALHRSPWESLSIMVCGSRNLHFRAESYLRFPTRTTWAFFSVRFFRLESPCCYRSSGPPTKYVPKERRY